jgi:hypothetical protein
VQGIPADTAIAVLGSIAGDSMSNASDLAQALRVNAQQIAGRLTLVANDRLDWIKRFQARQPGLFHEAADR